MPRTSYDLIVVGAGIQGAFLALEAQRRSLNVLLVDRAAIGSGTSNNSLRVVHGGFRYLQSLDLARFKRSRQEQQWFLENLPELVRPLPCLLPLDGKGTRRPSVARLGALVDRLLGSGALPPAEVLGKAEMARALGFAPHHAEAGLAWHDAVISDGQLVTRAITDWAAALGTEVVEYADVDALAVSQGRTSGIVGSVSAQGSRVVVAAGHANRLLASRFGVEESGRRSLSHSVAAYNVVLDRKAPFSGGLGFRPRGGGTSAYFALPRGRQVVAGTLYSSLRKDGTVPPTPPEGTVSAMLMALNRTVPGPEVRLDEVVGFDVGTLPCRPGTAEAAPSAQIVGPGRHGGPAGLWFVRPEKLTTARAVAEQALVHMFGSLPSVRPDSDRIRASSPSAGRMSW